VIRARALVRNRNRRTDHQHDYEHKHDVGESAAGDGVFYSARSARLRRVGSTITRADAAFRYRGRLQVMLMLSSCHLLTGCETAIWIVAVCAG